MILCVLAKQGTEEAIKTYMKLPCKDTVKTLFVPIMANKETISIPKYLDKFSKVYLPSNATKPTVNLLRKWYHTELYKLSQHQDQLLELMVNIDAHSKDVAKRHYVLQTPKDDAKLAKCLVHSLLGKPVPWPYGAEKHQLDAMGATLQLLVDAVPDEGVDEDDIDEGEFQMWDFASFFGIEDPLVPLWCGPMQVGPMRWNPKICGPETGPIGPEHWNPMICWLAG